MVRISGYQIKHEHASGADSIAPLVPVDKALGVLVGFMSVLGTVGNSIAIYVIGRVLAQQKKKRTDGVVSVFLNLAVCDLSVSVLSMPYTCYMLLFNYRDKDIFGSSHSMMNTVFCNISGFIFNIASRTSMYLILYISLTRSLALMMPFMQKCWLRKRNNFLCIMGCWFIGFILSVLPYTTGSKYSHVKTLAICTYRLDDIHTVHSRNEFWLLYLSLIMIPMALPGVIIVISSLIVIVKMSVKGKSIASFRVLNRIMAVRKSRFGQKMEAKAILKQRGGLSGIPSKGGALFTLCFIIAAFILCYTLFWAVSLEVFLEMLGVMPTMAFEVLFGSRSAQYLYFTSSVLCLYLNSVLNPIVYYFQGSRFKNSLPCHQKIERIRPNLNPPSCRRYTQYVDVVRTFDASKQSVAKIIIIGGGEEEMQDWEPKTFTDRLSYNFGRQSFKRRSSERTFSVVSNLITGVAMEELFSALSEPPEGCPIPDELGFLQKLKKESISKSIPPSTSPPYGDKRRILRKIQTQDHIFNIPELENDLGPTKSKLSRKSASFQDRSPTKPCSSGEPSFSRPHVLGSIQTVEPRSLISLPFKAEAPTPFELRSVQTIKPLSPQQNSPDNKSVLEPLISKYPSFKDSNSGPPSDKQLEIATEPSTQKPITGFTRPGSGFVRPGRAEPCDRPKVLGPPQKGFVRPGRAVSFEAVGSPQRGFDPCQPQQVTRGKPQVVKPMRADPTRPMVLGAPQRRPRAQRMVVTSIDTDDDKRGCVAHAGGPELVVQSMG